MPRKDYKFALFVFLLCLLIAWSAPADDVLVKIPLDDLEELLRSPWGNFAVRFIGKSFLLVQGDEGQFAGLSHPYVVLDRVKPDAVYYLVRVGRTEGHLPQLDELGDILLRFGVSALIRINPPDEPRLLSLGLPLTTLPENVKTTHPHPVLPPSRGKGTSGKELLYPQLGILPAPSLKSRVESAADAEVISEIVRSVSLDNLRGTVYELQENRDLDPPHIAYRSRYCLRVKETDDPSDDASDNAAEYIFNKFKSYGLDVEYDPFPHEVLTQGNYKMRNVVAILPGKGLNSGRIFLITAHYDSIASKTTNWLLGWKTMPAPGANDNGTGTAAVLEAARILSKYDFDSTIKFIAFSGEELGLHGSKHYAKLVAERKENIAGVLNLDTIAYDPDLPDVDVVANPGSEWLAEAMLSVQKAYNIGSLRLNKIVDPEMVYSDHAPFWQNGYSAIASIDNSDFDSPEFYPFMHTEKDTIDKLNFDMAYRMVQITVATLASLADPSDGMPNPDLAVAEKDVYLSAENPELGQPIQVTANIHNVGEADAEGARVQIWLLGPFARDPQLVAEEVVNVRAEGVARVSASLKLMEWGDYRVMVKANSDFKIFETDGGNNIASRVVRVGSESLALGKLMIYPNPMSSAAGDMVNIAYSLSKDASSRLEIYNASGSMVYQRYFVGGEPGGRFGPNNDIEWLGTNQHGEEVPGGVYFCYVIATDERGEMKSVSRKLIVIR